MLDFENQMLLDSLHEDGLLIAARGLGIEQQLISLIQSYSDEGNLVLIIGTSHHEEEFVISQLREKDAAPLPKCVTADCPVNSRSQMYLKGGCLFVTSRILVVDLLMDRVPSHLITGIIIWKAHKILESCQEAFILRLYRQKNKTGFIKALSNSPLSFTVGFCHVERVMKNLFVKKLYLWPRFHLEVSECLNKCKPEVIELHVKMTPAMKQIQMSLLDLISSTLQEIKLSNRAINFDEFCTENAISKSFEKMIKVLLDPIWHQLSTRTKQLVADLKVLRTLLMFLCQYDSVTFYNLLSSLRTTEKVLQSAGWMVLPAADVVAEHAKFRVFGEDSKGLSSPKKMGEIESGKEKGKQTFKAPSPEVCPKWVTLNDVLDEVRKESEELEGKCNCLVVTQDDRTSNQLRECLLESAKTVLKRNFYRSFGAKLGMAPPSSLFGRDNKKDGSSSSAPIQIGRVGQRGIKRKKGKEKGSKEEEEDITLTQIVKKYPQSESKEKESSDEGGQLSTVIHSLKDQNDPFKMLKVLKELSPRYIVMYDSDLEFVRQVEVWQARNPEVPCRVYFLIYKGTVEEQIYLTSIKREKGAFEHLIKEKASMVLPEYVEGKTDDHPDLHRDNASQSDKTANDVTRKAGGASVDDPEPITPRVIVDMREFRSELPSILHKRGIDIDPATIEVGDYILTPEICVERKSLSDLIGSLNSGRLYNQAQAMTRYYQKPILLIEFDHNKSFHLQGRLFLSTDLSSSTKDVSARLQLLTLHFPRLRLLWSPSPYATAELFHMLKTGKLEPNVTEAQAAKSDGHANYAPEKFNPIVKDFVSKLPGVTSKNIYIILENVTDLPQLLQMSEEEIAKLLENSKNAKELYKALHNPMKEQPKEFEYGKGKMRTKFGKKPLTKGR